MRHDPFASPDDPPAVAMDPAKPKKTRPEQSRGAVPPKAIAATIRGLPDATLAFLISTAPNWTTAAELRQALLDHCGEHPHFTDWRKAWDSLLNTAPRLRVSAVKPQSAWRSRFQHAHS